MLGKTVSGVRHLEGSELHPQKVNGRWLFEAGEVQQVAQRLRAVRGQELSPGELAARACELFREGKDAVDVVIALRQPFEVVLPLQRTFTQESRSLLLPHGIADRLAQICNVPTITAELLLHEFEQRDRTVQELVARLHDSRPNEPRR
jgi:hypothetical protein